jgi:tetratricopeptide (TPR) repeat protein
MWSSLLALAVAAQAAADNGACTAQLAIARDAYEQRAYARARMAFAAALTPCGMTPALLLALAQAELLSGDVEASLATLRRLESTGPLDVPAMKVRARALYLAARDHDAERTLVSAAALAPDDAEIPYDLGRMYYQQQRHQEAREAFSRAIAIDPRAYKAWDNLGLTWEALGDVEEATRHYARAMAIAHEEAPGYDVVYANYADLLIREGDYRRAFDAAAEAAQRNPRDARNFLLAGKALTRLDALEVSIKWLTQATALDPTLPEPHYLLARTYRRLGRNAEAEAAMAAFQDASARAPKVRR